LDAGRQIAFNPAPKEMPPRLLQMIELRKRIEALEKGEFVFGSSDGRSIPRTALQPSETTNVSWSSWRP
jgi:hypothetical protein